MIKQKFINLKELTIKELFTDIISNNAKIVIPYYQRDYIWNREQIQDLINDIERRAEDNNSHFFGNIVINEEIEDESIIKKWKYRIIDGQQRITTTLIFLKLLLSYSDLDIKLPFEKITFEFDNYDHTNSNLVLNDLINLLNDEKISFKDSNFGRNYNQVKEWLKEIAKDDSSKINKFLNTLLDKFLVGKLVYKIKLELEMTTFENINSKGSRLSEFDLIKNFLIYFNFNKDDSKNFILNFNSKIEALKYTYNLDKKKIKEEFKNFISYLIHWKVGYKNVKKYSQYQIYKNFNNLILDKYKNYSKNDLLEHLIKFFSLYLETTQKKPKTKVGKDLWFSVTRHQPIRSSLIFFLFDKYSKFENDRWELNQKIINYIKIVSSHLLKFMYCNGTGFSWGPLYEWIINFIKKNDEPLELKKWLEINEDVPIGNTPSHEKIIKTLSSINQDWIARAILEIIEKEYATNEIISFKNSTSLEHIIPQKINPKNDDWKHLLEVENWEIIHKESLNKLGNLLLIDKHDNSKIKNNSFFTKYQKFYSDSKMILINSNNQLINKYKLKPLKDYLDTNFGYKEIETRTRQILQIALEIMETI